MTKNLDSPYVRTLRAAEKSMIEYALKSADGNVVTAAVALGISHAALYRRCRALAIGPYSGGQQRLKRYPKHRKKQRRTSGTLDKPVRTPAAAAPADVQPHRGRPVGGYVVSEKELAVKRRVAEILEEDAADALTASEPDEDDIDDEDDDTDGDDLAEDDLDDEDDEADEDDEDGDGDDEDSVE